MHLSDFDSPRTTEPKYRNEVPHSYDDERHCAGDIAEIPIWKSAQLIKKVIAEGYDLSKVPFYLRPSPDPFLRKAADTDFDKTYVELIALSKRLNRIIQDESPELIRPVEPPKQTSFGFINGR
jgi:hypothetical protein